MDKEENKPLVPKIPTLKDSKTPTVKIKGLAAGPMSLISRLKQFKQKDLAFISAGLGVLFMAPLAEHFMMAPENGAAGSSFKEGWGFRDGAGALGRGASPYEGGVNGLAPGGYLGGGSDVITPLNVRDPSALVMGPNQTAPVPVSAPQAPPSKPEPSWKDALASSASRGVKEAIKAASPVPKIPLQGGLRGLGAVSGGSAGGYTLPPISAGNVPNTASGSRALTRVTPATGYKGTAGARGPDNMSSGALENLKKAAAGASNEMNRGGSAAGNLDSASAASNFPSGAQGDGGASGGTGGADKSASQNQGAGSKSGGGESLAFAMKKARMEKDMEIEYAIKKRDAMFWGDLKNEALKTFATDGLVKPLAKVVGDLFEWPKADAVSKWTCYDRPEDKLGREYLPIKSADIADKCGATEKDGKGLCWCPGKGNGVSGGQICKNPGLEPYAYNCTGGKASGKPETDTTAPSPPEKAVHDAPDGAGTKDSGTGGGRVVDPKSVISPVDPNGTNTNKNLTAICADLTAEVKKASLGPKEKGYNKEYSEKHSAQALELKKAANGLIDADMELWGSKAPVKECGGYAPEGGGGVGFYEQLGGIVSTKFIQKTEGAVWKIEEALQHSRNAVLGIHAAVSIKSVANAKGKPRPSADFDNLLSYADKSEDSDKEISSWRDVIAFAREGEGKVPNAYSSAMKDVRLEIEKARNSNDAAGGHITRAEGEMDKFNAALGKAAVKLKGEASSLSGVTVAAANQDQADIQYAKFKADLAVFQNLRGKQFEEIQTTAKSFVGDKGRASGAAAEGALQRARAALKKNEGAISQVNDLAGNDDTASVKSLSGLKAWVHGSVGEYTSATGAPYKAGMKIVRNQFSEQVGRLLQNKLIQKNFEGGLVKDVLPEMEFYKSGEGALIQKCHYTKQDSNGFSCP